MTTFKTKSGKKFNSDFHGVFNPVPSNEEEADAHGNALAATGHYPVGTSECFNVGISGGCGADCFVYEKGECGESQEMIARATKEQLVEHYELYPEDRKYEQ